MARYRLTTKAFLNGEIQPANSEVVLPDDTVPGSYMIPLDDPAKRAMDKLRKEKPWLVAGIQYDPIAVLPMKTGKTPPKPLVLKTEEPEEKEDEEKGE